jgi:hypothetical protein
VNWDKSFLKGLLRESDGTPSSSRTLTACVILASLCWISYVVIKTHALPDLTTVSAFDTVVGGSLYGLNRLSQTAKDLVGNKSGSTPE